MKLSTAAAHVWNHETASTPIPQPSNDNLEGTDHDDIVEDSTHKDELYIVTVDSREEDSPSNLKCFQENYCPLEFFRDHIRDDPRMICVESQVAKMCGLNLKVYFHHNDRPRSQPEPPHHHHHHHHHHSHINAAATLLLLHPETGKFHHAILSKAYVLVDDGRTPLSRRQVWGLVEFMREARALVNDEKQTPDEALQQLYHWCAKYRQERWVPHGIYEDRVEHAQHACHHRHHQPHSNNNEEGHDLTTTKNTTKSKGCHSGDLCKQDSGVTDAATCHHGKCHHHHNVTPDHDEIIEIAPKDDDKEVEAAELQQHHGHQHHHQPLRTSCLEESRTLARCI
jgi:hypothetical protein